MMPRISCKRFSSGTSPIPAKRNKIDYGYLKDFDKLKKLTLSKIKNIPLYRRLEQAPKIEETVEAISNMGNSNVLHCDDLKKALTD